MLHLAFILLLIYNLFKDSNCKVKLERSRLWQHLPRFAFL